MQGFFKFFGNPKIFFFQSILHKEEDGDIALFKEVKTTLIEKKKLKIKPKRLVWLTDEKSAEFFFVVLKKS